LLISPRLPVGMMMVWDFPDWPNRGEEKRRIERMMRSCFNWFPFCVD